MTPTLFFAQSTLATYQGDIPEDLNRASKSLLKRQFSLAYYEISHINKLSLPLTLQVITQLFIGICCYYYQTKTEYTYRMLQPMRTGITYHYIGYSYPQRKAAKEAFEEAIKLDSTCYAAYLGLGKTLVKLNEKQKGFCYIVKAVQLSHFNSEIVRQCKKTYQKEIELQFLDCWEKHDPTPSLKSLESLATSPWAYDRVRAVLGIKRFLKIHRLAGTEEETALNILLNRLAGITICGISILGTGDSDHRVRQTAWLIQEDTLA